MSSAAWAQLSCSRAYLHPTVTLLARVIVQHAAVVVTKVVEELLVLDHFEHVLAAAVVLVIIPDRRVDNS